MTQDSGAHESGGQQYAMPGRGGLTRIWKAAGNSLRGLRHAVATEAAVKQELAIVCLAVPLSFVLARGVVEWVVLIGCLALMLAAEFLNTAIEGLCNHVTPRRHDAIRDIKDVASAGVFMVQLLAVIAWSAVALDRFGLFG